MSAAVDLGQRLTIRPDVLARNVGDETVILDLASGTYFGLDPVGARVWTLLQGGRTLGDICDALEGEFDVARLQLETDVVRLAGELRAQQLVDVADG